MSGNKAGWLERTLQFFGANRETGKGLASGEGSWRGPFDGFGELGNSFALGSWEDGWSRNLTPNVERWRVAIVYACVMMNARAMSQCEPKHMRQAEDGSYVKVTTSPASRIVRIPNAYETWPQILTNTIAEMLFQGESLWLVVRDERYAVVAVHRVPRHSWTVYLDTESTEYFYQINANGNLFSRPDYLVPAREVCHFRQHCPRHPMVGESAVSAASLAIGLQVALNQSQLAFFSNMDRPSGTLQTDLELDANQVRELRARFSEQSKKWNQGGTPILTHGMKFSSVGVAQNDAQLVEQQKMSALDIARVFGVPYALVSDTAGPQAGTEALISLWMSIGLASLIECVERSLDRLFRFDANERIELDPTALLRVDQASLVDALGSGIQKGVYTPDEARGRLRLGRVPGGDQVYLQRQMTSLDLLAELNAAELAGKTAQPEQSPPASPDPAPEDEQDNQDNQDNQDSADKHVDPEIAKALVISLRERKRKERIA